jgi:hypothetical protein
VVFKKIDENTAEVTETFEMESTDSEELQRQGWQAILESFKLSTKSIWGYYGDFLLKNCLITITMFITWLNLR